MERAIAYYGVVIGISGVNAHEDVLRGRRTVAGL
jgi:hypothetical protein